MADRALHKAIEKDPGAVMNSRLMQAMMVDYLFYGKDAYIDGGDKDSNEKRFAQLESSKEEIESEIGGKFDWERLDDKKACRISVVRPGSIHDDQKNLDEIRNWMIEKLPAFKKTFGSRLAELVD